VADRVSGRVVLMLHVETLHAVSAAATAAYYTRYLTEAPGEAPGVWSGGQAAGLGLAGEVSGGELELLLRGRDPTGGTPLGSVLKDRVKADGKKIEAVAGFDATFSAPKTVSVWWGLTQDERLLAAHDAAVAATLAHLERFGSTTRVRVNGHRQHPDTQGLTMAWFRQTTSRDDDPQLHTHVVISAKVQTTDGRWYALDARYLKRKQRMLGGLYQSLLRSELTARFGVDWHPIVTGQAEIVGVPRELLRAFSKRSAVIERALTVKVAGFRQREGREPSRFERAAMQREAAKDTRPKKSGNGVSGLVTRWRTEAEAVGWTGELLTEAITTAGRAQAERPVARLTMAEVVEALGVKASTWCRSDVLRKICDVQRPLSDMPARRWLDVLERAADRVVEHCVDLDPAGSVTRRGSDGRSVWIEPTAPGLTSEAVLAEEEAIVTWAIHAQLDPPQPSTTVNVDGLDVFQAEAAPAVAGHDPLVLAAGAAGTGKTDALSRAREDLERHGRVVFGLAPTAKAARTLQDKAGIASDTVAKLLHELGRDQPDPRCRLPAGTTVVVDEAGMINTAHLRRLVHLAEWHSWRLVLVGDPLQLQAVGRGGLFDELLRHGRVYPLEHVHRFTHPWEAQASLKVRAGDSQALDAYEAHGRIVPGTLDEHLDAIAQAWVDRHRNGDTVAVVASTNDHVDLLNDAIQTQRITLGDLDRSTAVVIGGGEQAHVGDVVATRRNDRRLLTSSGEPVRNRELWTVTTTHLDGSLAVINNDGHGQVTLPGDYVREHVRLGYAATEHGYQSDTVTAGHSLAGDATTRRGLYVAVTRGRDDNQIHVTTQSHDVAEARDVLERILAVDRADVPAVTQRQRLAEQDHPTSPSTPKPRVRRCEIPDWFEQLRDQTRHELADLQERVTVRAATRQRLQADLDRAQRDVDRLDQPTRQQRHQLAAAHHDLDDAKVEHRLAVHRLETSGIRGRRQARRDLAAAKNRLIWATHTLDELHQQSSLDVDRYHEATRQLHDLGDALRSHDTRELLDRYTTSDRIPELRQRLDALDTWLRFANGDSINVDGLGKLVDVLRTVHGDQGKCRWLADAVEQYCHDVGIHLPSFQPQMPGVEAHGLDVGW
jgi:conjugative relaxase-like TrwC/TraI family protein